MFDANAQTSADNTIGVPALEISNELEVITPNEETVDYFAELILDREKETIAASSVHQIVSDGSYIIFAVRTADGSTFYKYLFDQNKNFVDKQKTSFEKVKEFIDKI